MIKQILTLSLVILLASCGAKTQKINTMEESKSKKDSSATPVDTTPKVTGIGGVFFGSDDTKKTKEWYAQNLGIDINNWGSASFDYRNLNNPDQVTSLQWKPFKKGDEYFAPSKKEFMINYTCQNIEGLVEKLKASGSTILDSIATYDYGKFVHIMDPEGNKIELWEPVYDEKK